MAKELTGKQKQFCLEYAETLNITQSMKNAGYNGNDNVLAGSGSVMLRDERIKAEIAALRKDKIATTHVTIDMIVTKLWQIADADLTDCFTPTGQLKNLEDIPPGTRKALAGIDTYADFTEGVEIGETKKIKLWDKMKALELLGKYLGMYVEKTQNTNLNVNIDANKPESEAFKRVKQAMIDSKPIDVKPIKLVAKGEE